MYIVKYAPQLYINEIGHNKIVNSSIAMQTISIYTIRGVFTENKGLSEPNNKHDVSNIIITIKERGTLNSFSIIVNIRWKKLNRLNFWLSSCTVLIIKTKAIINTINKSNELTITLNVRLVCAVNSKCGVTSVTMSSIA